jgi:hypothetical protein
MDEIRQVLQDLAVLRRDHPEHLARIDLAVDQATRLLMDVRGTVEEEARRAAPRPADVALTGLPGVIDLTALDGDTDDADSADPDNVDHEDDPDALEDAVEAVFAGIDDPFGDPDGELPPTVDLIATIEGAEDADAARAALETILPAAAEIGWPYRPVPDTVTATGATLTAEVGIAEGDLPAGTVVFRGTVPDAGITVVLAVAGEVDPANPPLDPQAATQVVLDELDAAGGPLDPVAEVRIVMERLDGAELALTDAARVLDTAVVAFNAQMGEHHVREIIDGDSPAIKVGVLEPAGDGAVDRRALAVGVAAFTGVLPFPGIGRVRARAHVA